MLELYTFSKELEDKILDLDEGLITLGDTYLNNYVSNKLNLEFAYFDNETKNYFDLNTLNNVKTKILSNDYLTDRAIKLHFNDISQKNDKYFDLFKAFVGAYLVDSFEADTDFIDKLLNLDEGILLNIDLDNNYFKMVYDWSKHKYKEAIQYDVLKSNDYQATITLKDIPNQFVKNNKRKYLALLEASKDAYKYLEENHLLLKMKDIIGFADLEKCVNQLQELYIKGYINEPVYKISLKGSSGGVDTWRCRILIDGYKESFSFDDTSKKVVKRNAAFAMLKYILEQEK